MSVKTELSLRALRTLRFKNHAKDVAKPEANAPSLNESELACIYPVPRFRVESKHLTSAAMASHGFGYALIAYRGDGARFLMSVGVRT
jgi:hypothetical protein